MEAVASSQLMYVVNLIGLTLVAFLCVGVAFYTTSIVQKMLGKPNGVWHTLDVYTLLTGVFIGMLIVSPFVIIINIITLVLDLTGVYDFTSDEEPEGEFKY